MKRASLHPVMLFITSGLLETQETHSVLHLYHASFRHILQTVLSGDIFLFGCNNCDTCRAGDV